MTQMQTMAAGNTVATNFGSFGTTGRLSLPSPAHSFMLLVSRSGAGKTTFLQSHPGALIVNCDQSETPVNRAMGGKPPKAAFFPFIDGDGRAVDENGHPFIFKYEHVRAMKQRLIAAAEQNAPRPQTIVFDSNVTLLSMMIAEQTANLNKTTFSARDDVDWAGIYDDLVKMMTDLRAVGYGIILTAHLEKVHIPLGENLTREDVQLSGITPKLYGRLRPRLSLILALERKRVTSMETRPIQVAPGKTIDKQVAVEKEITQIVNYSPALAELVKGRVSLPDTIPVSGDNGWADFCEAYRKANDL